MVSLDGNGELTFSTGGSGGASGDDSEDVTASSTTGLGQGTVFPREDEEEEDETFRETASSVESADVPDDDGGGGGFFGGIVDAASDVAGGATDVAGDAAGAAEDAAGWAGGGIADFTGATEWAQSDAAERFQEDMADNTGGVMGVLQDFDTATQAGMDFLLDNPNASLQEGAQEAMKFPTEFVTGEEVSDEELGQAFETVATETTEAVDTAVEGTPFDNPVTDAAATGFDWFVGDPAKALFRGTTGVSIDDGGTEGTVGAVDAFDVGVTVGTLGVGSATTSAVRGADEAADAGGFFGRLFGGADEAADAGGFFGRLFGGADEGAAAADETTSAVDESVDGSQLLRDSQATVEDVSTGAADDSGTLLTDGGEDVFNPRNLPVVADETAMVADEGAGAADDLAGAADDAAAATDEGTGPLSGLLGGGAVFADETARATRTLADEIFGGLFRGSDEAAGLTDDTAGAFDETAQAGDEGAGLLDEGAGATDDAATATDDGAGLLDEGAQTSDELAQAGDESPGFFRRFLGTTTGKVTAAGAGVVGGGALLEALGTFDQLTVTDPTTGETFALVKEKDYPPTETRDGGTLWDVRTGTQEQGFTNSQGYTIILGVSGRNVYILGQDGDRRRAQVPVETFKEALSRARGAGGAA